MFRGWVDGHSGPRVTSLACAIAADDDSSCGAFAECWPSLGPHAEALIRRFHTWISRDWAPGNPGTCPESQDSGLRPRPASFPDHRVVFPAPKSPSLEARGVGEGRSHSASAHSSTRSRFLQPLHSQHRPGTLPEGRLGWGGVLQEEATGRGHAQSPPESRARCPGVCGCLVSGSWWFCQACAGTEPGSKDLLPLLNTDTPALPPPGAPREVPLCSGQHSERRGEVALLGAHPALPEIRLQGVLLPGSQPRGDGHLPLHHPPVHLAGCPPRPPCPGCLHQGETAWSVCVSGSGYSQDLGWKPGRTWQRGGKGSTYWEGSTLGSWGADACRAGRWAEAAGTSSRCPRPVGTRVSGRSIGSWCRNLARSVPPWLGPETSSVLSARSRLRGGRPPDLMVLEACGARDPQLPVAGSPGPASYGIMSPFLDPRTGPRLLQSRSACGQCWRTCLRGGGREPAARRFFFLTFPGAHTSFSKHVVNSGARAVTPVWAWKPLLGRPPSCVS